MKEREDKELIDIRATIYCDKENHKGMIIGKNGAMLKSIASKARIAIEDFLAMPVNLQCWVKVREDWKNSLASLRQFGFENEKK